MKLRDLLKNVEILSATADPEMEIRDVCYDSRAVKEGDLFVVPAERKQLPAHSDRVYQHLRRGAYVGSQPDRCEADLHQRNGILRYELYTPRWYVHRILRWHELVLPN